MRPTISVRGCLRATPALVLVVGLASPATAQRPYDVKINPIAETDAVHPGTSARVALEISLDAGYHVNSNTPLDEFLIPTILTVNPPTGISLGGVAFPEAIVLVGPLGPEEPLAVFEEEFLIGATLTLDGGAAPWVVCRPRRIALSGLQRQDVLHAGKKVAISSSTSTSWRPLRRSAPSIRISSAV